MNKSYKSIYNQLTRTWVAVSELTRARGKNSSRAIRLTAIAAVLMSLGSVAVAETIDGSNNIASGTNAGGTGTGAGSVVGSNNIGVGQTTGQSVSGSRNTAVGAASGIQVAGTGNTTTGSYAGTDIIGSNNSSTGT